MTCEFGSLTDRRPHLIGACAASGRWERSAAMTEIYRAPMRARDRDLPDGAGAEHGLARGLVGIGDALAEEVAGRLARPGDDPAAAGTACDDDAVPASGGTRALDDAVAAATTEHGEKAGRMLRRFAELPDGAFVWTRVGDGSYRLGRIAGPWRYDDSAAARAVGIHHVRPADWLDRPVGEHEVPPAVAATFARGGRNLQRTHDAGAERATAKLWREAAATNCLAKSS